MQGNQLSIRHVSCFSALSLFSSWLNIINILSWSPKLTPVFSDDSSHVRVSVNDTIGREISDLTGYTGLTPLDVISNDNFNYLIDKTGETYIQRKLFFRSECKFAF